MVLITLRSNLFNHSFTPVLPLWIRRQSRGDLILIRFQPQEAKLEASLTDYRGIALINHRKELKQKIKTRTLRTVKILDRRFDYYWAPKQNIVYGHNNKENVSEWASSYIVERHVTSPLCVMVGYLKIHECMWGLTSTLMDCFIEFVC